MTRTSIAILMIALSVRSAAADDSPRSEAGATAMSVGGTLLPIAAIALVAGSANGPFDGPVQLSSGATFGLLAAAGTGLVFGPSLGHIYAGHGWTKGMAHRLLGGGLFVVGTAMISGSVFHSSTSGVGIGGAIDAVGLLLIAGGAISDISTAGEAARRWNTEHALQIAPTVVGQTHAPGLVLGGRF
jgi:hypothetical protein